MRRWLLPGAAARGADRRSGRSPPRPGRSPTRSVSKSFLVPSPAEIAELALGEPRLLAENAWVTLREILLGIARRPGRRRRLRGPDAPLGSSCATPPTRWSSPRRRSRSSSSRRSWSSGSATGSAPKVAARRPGLLLPDHRQRPRRAALGRPRGGEDDAQPRRLALAAVPAGRSADRPAESLHRDQDRRRLRADRRRLRRVGRLQLRPRPPDPVRTTPTSRSRASSPRSPSSRRWRSP